jgi:acetoin utilization protein AcuB
VPERVDTPHRRVAKRQVILRRMEANEIMHTDVAVLTPQASLKDVADLMRDRDIRHVPIVEGGRVVGIVSDRDIRLYVADLFESQGETTLEASRKTLTIRNVMQSKPVQVDPSTDVSEVVDLLLEYRIGAVLVSDTQGTLRGIVSYEDILRTYRDQETE